MVSGGETLNTYDATLYSIQVESESEPLVYQGPPEPLLTTGQQVNVTFAKRGLFGKPLVYKVE